MKRTFLFLLFALPALAQTPREVYPSDYKPLACAPKDVCKSFARVDFARWAGAHRKLPIRQEWVEAHWDEMLTAFNPSCAKIANCLAVPGNDWVFCTDFMRSELVVTADRWPKGSDDYDQWKMSALVFYIGLDNALMVGEAEAQKCAREQKAPGERKLEVWVFPAKVDATYGGNLTIYTLDAETRIPVKAQIAMEGQTLKPANDSPNGHAMSFYKFPWPVTFNAVTNAEGHRDLVAPSAVLTADGYEVVTVPIPVDVPKAIVEMQPPPSQLKVGTNTVTVAARDAITGKPVELRVLAGQEILGNTNKPLTLEIPQGTKRPEIWVTSLFNRYSDVVVARGE